MESSGIRVYMQPSLVECTNVLRMRIFDNQQINISIQSIFFVIVSLAFDS